MLINTHPRSEQIKQVYFWLVIKMIKDDFSSTSVKELCDALKSNRLNTDIILEQKLEERSRTTKNKLQLFSKNGYADHDTEWFTVDRDSDFSLVAGSLLTVSKAEWQIAGKGTCSGREYATDFNDVSLYHWTTFPHSEKLVKEIIIHLEDTQENTTAQENKTMNAPKNVLSAAIAANKNGAATAAKVAVGSAANKALVKMVKPRLPMLARGYADNVLARVVLANAALLAVETIASDNPKAKIVTQAMVDASMIELVQEIDIAGLISGLIDNLQGSQVDKLMAENGHNPDVINVD